MIKNTRETIKLLLQAAAAMAAMVEAAVVAVAIGDGNRQRSAVGDSLTASLSLSLYLCTDVHRVTESNAKK